MKTIRIVLLIALQAGFSVVVLNSTYRAGHAVGVADEHAYIEQLRMQKAAAEPPPTIEYCDSVDWKSDGCRWYAAGYVDEFRKMQKMQGH